MSAQAAVAGVMSTCADQTRVFFDILTHDDHNSNYLLARNAYGSWSTRPVRAGEYSRLAFHDKASYYLTRNGFVGAKRLTERCRQVNSLMFDIDCHGEGATSVLPDLTATLYDAFNEGLLPQPSLFVFSGRGLHLYYVLDNATPYRIKGGTINERGIKFVRDVEAGLCRRIGRVVSAIPQAEVDTSVFDFTRIARVPGSWNEKANCECVLLSYSTDFPTLLDLKAFCDPEQKSSIAKSVPNAPRHSQYTIRFGRVMKFNRLMTARLRKVEELQAYRKFDCEGSRENMCFVHYNTATQIYGPDEALRLTFAFNRRFKHPLPDSDISFIKKTVDNVVIVHGSCKGQRGFYPLSVSSLCNKLHLSPVEIKETNFFSSQKSDQRAASKAATKIRRQRRDDEIVRLYAKEGLTQAQIVERLSTTEVACCLRTVASVLSKAQAKRARKESLIEATEKALSRKNLLEGQKATECPRNVASTEGAMEQVAQEHAKSWPTSCCVTLFPSFLGPRLDLGPLFSVPLSSSLELLASPVYFSCAETGETLFSVPSPPSSYSSFYCSLKNAQ